VVVTGRGIVLDGYREIRRSTAKLCVDFQRTIYPRRKVICRDTGLFNK